MLPSVVIFVAMFSTLFITTGSVAYVDTTIDSWGLVSIHYRACETNRFE